MKLSSWQFIAAATFSSRTWIPLRRNELKWRLVRLPFNVRVFNVIWMHMLVFLLLVSTFEVLIMCCYSESFLVQLEFRQKKYLVKWEYLSLLLSIRKTVICYFEFCLVLFYGFRFETEVNLDFNLRNWFILLRRNFG